MALPEMTIQDVADRYEGSLEDEFESRYLLAQLGDAIDFAASRWRSRIEERLRSGELTPNLYKRVISDAVMRVVRNPAGYSAENEGGYGYSTRASVASGNLWFTDTDITTLIGPDLMLGPGTIALGIDHGWR